MGLGLFGLLVGGTGTAQKPPAEPDAEYATAVRPLLAKYCLECHSARAKKGGLDLERISSLEQVRKDLKPWQQLIEMVDAGEMPPKAKPQPTAGERERLVAWTRGFLDAQARPRPGHPGHVRSRPPSNPRH